MAEASLALNLIARKVGEGIKQAHKELGGLDKTVKSLKDPLAGAAAGLAAVTAAIALTAGETVKYAAEVRDMGRAIGASAEDTSKLIQAADDVGISVGTLEGALKAAIARGVKPTIENLGKLADEYNNIQSPIARSEFLMKNFGKSGLEMGKLLEQGAEGIKAAGEEAEALGLVLTETDVKAAREFEIAMDNLGDVVQGLQFSVGNALIPTLTQAASTLQLLLTWNQQVAAAVDQHKQSVLTNSETYAAYVAEMERVAGASGGVNSNFTALIDKQNILSESAFNAASAAARIGDEEDKLKDSTYNAAAAMGEAESKTYDLSASLAELEQHTKDVQKAQEAWGESTATDIQRALEDAEIKGTEYEAALSVIDSTLGTSKLNQEQYDKKMQAIVDQFKKTGDINAFRDGINQLKDAFGPAAQEAANMQAELLGFTETLALLPPVTELVVHTTFTETGTPPPGYYSGNTTGTPPSGTPRQAGGPVLGGQRVRWNERGSEMFIGGGGGAIMNNNDLRRMVAALEALAGKGGGLNMTINTAAQPNIGGLASQARAIAGAFR